MVKCPAITAGHFFYVHPPDIMILHKVGKSLLAFGIYRYNMK